MTHNNAIFWFRHPSPNINLKDEVFSAVIPVLPKKINVGRYF